MMRTCYPVQFWLAVHYSVKGVLWGNHHCYVSRTPSNSSLIISKAIVSVHQGYFPIYQGINALTSNAIVYYWKKTEIFLKHRYFYSNFNIFTNLWRGRSLSVNWVGTFVATLKNNYKISILICAVEGHKIVTFLLFMVRNSLTDFWKPQNKFCQKQGIVSIKFWSGEMNVETLFLSILATTCYVP